MLVRIQARGIHPRAVDGLKAEHGDIFGKVGEVVARSPRYNSSFLVNIEGRVIDLHDQWFKRISPLECLAAQA